MASEASGKGLLLKADAIANTFRDEIKTSLSVCSRKPKLVGILATSSAPSKSYADFTKKQCDALGVEFVLKLIGAAACPEGSEGEGVEEAIIEANEDDSIDGIMVSLVPLELTLVNIRNYLYAARCRYIIPFLVFSRSVAHFPIACVMQTRVNNIIISHS